jgi:hypothetical protein
MGARRMQRRAHFGHKGAIPAQPRCKSRCTTRSTQRTQQLASAVHVARRGAVPVQFRCSSGARQQFEHFLCMRHNGCKCDTEQDFDSLCSLVLQRTEAIAFSGHSGTAQNLLFSVRPWGKVARLAWRHAKHESVTLLGWEEALVPRARTWLSGQQLTPRCLPLFDTWTARLSGGETGDERERLAG